MPLIEDRRRFFDRLSAIEAELGADAERGDGEAAFPDRSLATLRELGALTAALPEAMGGLNLGADSEGEPAAIFMRLLGRGSIAIGRLLEGHVNALRLIALYGNAAQLAAAAADAAGGHLFGIWVTEIDAPLQLLGSAEALHLEGGKNFCSGAGRVTRPLVTALSREEPPLLVLVRLNGSEPVGAARSMAGVRGARTADMDLTGVSVAASDVIGAPGDYLKQPEFSAGAWRGSAVALGGLEAVVDAAIGQLKARGRHGNPHQAARVGRMLIAVETARLWVGRASRAGGSAGDRSGLVNLGRIAVETVCLDAIVEVQRALGLSAFVRSNPVERMLRDLATYLRQPAPDETLTEAALWFAEHGWPAGPAGDA